MEENTNCLQGFKCPGCESLGPFWIRATISAEVLMSDKGTVEERDVSTDWEQDANCRCPECGYEATVRNFRSLLTRLKKRFS